MPGPFREMMGTRVPPVTKDVAEALAKGRGLTPAAWTREAILEKVAREVRSACPTPGESDPEAGP